VEGGEDGKEGSFKEEEARIAIRGGRDLLVNTASEFRSLTNTDRSRDQAGHDTTLKDHREVGVLKS